MPTSALLGQGSCVLGPDTGFHVTDHRPTRTDACPSLTFPSVLSWKLSTRAASVHLAATSRAAFRRRSWKNGKQSQGDKSMRLLFSKLQPPPAQFWPGNISPLCHVLL